MSSAGTIRPGAGREPPSEATLLLRVTIVVTLGMMAGALLQWVPDEPSVWRWLPLGIAYLVGGGPILEGTWEELQDGKLSIDFLMGAAALGAAGLGQPLEGAILIFLFSLSNTLEAYAMGRTRSAIAELMDLHPEEASLLDASGREVGRVAAASLVPGQRILVRPGERIAADGQVADGRSEVDQSAITGEAMPVVRTAGDRVFAGTINGGGSLVVEVTKPASDTMLARIVRMVEEAREERAPAQEFIDRFAHPYTVGVLLVACLTTLVGGLVLDWSWGDAVYRGMTFLVVGSPCALVISTPAAVLSAIAAGARNGVLLKGGGVLDRAGLVDVVAFDKTGTLTVGRPRLLALLATGTDEGELLRAAVAVEATAEHHMARAVLEAARERGTPIEPVDGFRAIPGEGVEGRMRNGGAGTVRPGGGDSRPPSGEVVWVGNATMARRHGATVPDEVERWTGEQADLGRSVVLVGCDGRVLGALAFGDELRPGVRGTVDRLRGLGIRRIAILSGDHPRAVQTIARELGADEVRAGLLPDEKVEVVRKLADGAHGVAMVGDGVNDAPAMVAATLGVAMGAAGTDVAIETADVILMSDELPKVEYLVRLGRRARAVVRQNVWFSVGWMAFLVTTASVVTLPLTLAVVAHEGSTLLVVLNGLRLLRGGRA